MDEIHHEDILAQVSLQFLQMKDNIQHLVFDIELNLCKLSIFHLIYIPVKQVLQTVNGIVRTLSTSCLYNIIKKLKNIKKFQIKIS